MRIAALFDIHGNLPALEAVLAELGEDEVDRIVVGGDVVPGPMPAACLARLRELDLPASFIRGNGDVDVLRFRAGEAPRRVPPAFHEGMRWCADTLDAPTARWMAGWPLTTGFDVAGLGRVVFCHATPRDENEIFTARTPTERLLPVFDDVDAALVVCGHTHMPFDRRVGATRVVNAGSVGMPFGAPGAYWAVVDRHGIALRRTEYDVVAADRLAEASGYPDAGFMSFATPPDAAAMMDAFEAAAFQGVDDSTEGVADDATDGSTDDATDGSIPPRPDSGWLRG